MLPALPPPGGRASVAEGPEAPAAGELASTGGSAQRDLSGWGW
jgi:hypothetical protein